MFQNPPLTSSELLTIAVDHIDLLTVTGQLDDPGLDRLQLQLDELLDGDTRLVLIDLSCVSVCDGGLFYLLARTQHVLEQRGGRLRLVGLARPVLDALDRAALPEVLLVYRAARWAC